MLEFNMQASCRLLFKLRHQNVQWQLEHFDNANMRHVLLYQTSDSDMRL
jgi:hypothetical protein